jgi:putative transposase
LAGEVAEAAEKIIKETCKKLDIEVIDLAMNVDHVHLFIKPFKKAFTEKCFADPQKYSVSWIPKRIKGRSSKQTLLEKAFTEKRFAVRDKFQQLKEWCPGHLWAPSCYHKTFKKSFIKNASQSVGHGWEVVERYISGQKGYRYEKPEAIRGRGEKEEGRGVRYSYEKTDTVPIVVIDENKEKTHKTGIYRYILNFLRGRGCTISKNAMVKKIKNRKGYILPVITLRICALHTPHLFIFMPFT